MAKITIPMILYLNCYLKDLGCLNSDNYICSVNGDSCKTSGIISEFLDSRDAYTLPIAGHLRGRFERKDGITSFVNLDQSICLL